MFTFGYKDRRWRIIKDVILLLVCVFLIVRTGFWGILLGAAGFIWYGRDLYTLLRAERLEKERDKQMATQAPREEGKIQLHDDAKDVDFEKE